MPQWIRLTTEVGGYSPGSTLYLPEEFAQALLDTGDAEAYTPMDETIGVRMPPGDVTHAPPAEASERLPMVEDAALEEGMPRDYHPGASRRRAGN